MNDTGGANKAIAVLENQHDTPFFLAYGSFNPHMPWYVPEKYFDMYPLDQIVLPELKDDDLDDLPPLAQAVSDGIGSFADKVIRSGKHKEAVQAYLATTTYVDTQFGRVLDALAKSPHRDNTIVIFQSDHGHSTEVRTFGGGGSAGPYRGAKFSLFEGGIRVPAVISWPGHLPEGVTREQLSHSCDWLPTRAELDFIPRRVIEEMIQQQQVVTFNGRVTGLGDGAAVPITRVGPFVAFTNYNNHCF